VDELRALVKKYHLQDRFNFVPHQTDNIDALSALDALVLPSQEEPFGRVVIEAMALEKVVIAYAQNGPLEIITHGHDGLLVPLEETGGLAKMMRQILQDDEWRVHLQHHARLSVVEKFHISESAGRIFALYQEFAGEPRG
jgi:glycosyltransferase involved in cell wall biosynthesis